MVGGGGGGGINPISQSIFGLNPSPTESSNEEKGVKYAIFGHIIQLCRHASPSPIVEGVVNGNTKDYMSLKLDAVFKSHISRCNSK